MAFPTKTIPVGQLLLDLKNPRHEKVASQKDAIQALIATERQKLVVLAKDILKYGISPIDRLLVLKAGRNYTVLEGNRRLAVVRMLANPSLAEGTVIERQIKRLSAEGSLPTEADCAIAPTRKAASHWMKLRHGGEAEGAGVVPWNTLAANRFGGNPNREATAAIRFLEQLEAAYPKNDVMQSLIRDVAANKLTTLGRLVLDSSFQQRAGMVDSGESLTFEFPAAALEDFFEQVLTDLSTTVGISSLRKKPDRAKYLKKTPEPDPTARGASASPLAESKRKKAAPKPKRPKPSPKPPKPFKDLDLSQLDSKTQTLLREFKSLKMDKTPHASAVLMRCILELAVDGYIEAKGLSRGSELHQRVKKCLGKLDPKRDNEQFKAVRTGLDDGTSFYSIRTLHAFVHDKYFLADAITLGNIAGNMEPFLQALNDDV